MISILSNSESVAPESTLPLTASSQGQGLQAAFRLIEAPAVSYLRTSFTISA
jgi:hypothetical protein